MRNKAFENLVFKDYGQDSNYDKIIFNLERCYTIFMRQVPFFRKMTAAEQYKICSTSVLMTTCTVTQQITNLRIISKKEHSQYVKDYSIDYGYQDPDHVRIDRPVIRMLKQ